MNKLFLISLLTYITKSLAGEASDAELFEKFKVDFDRKYESKEIEEQHFQNFVNNLKMLESNRANVKTEGVAESDIERHDINEFFDKDLSDHAALFPEVDTSFLKKNLRGERELTVCTPSTTLTDWSGNAMVTAVKNAGFCLGSGWAFAVASQVETDVYRQHGSSYNYVLSPEQLLQCVTNSNGCSGGTAEYAYQYLQTYGLELNNNYPYTSFFGSTGGPCNYQSSNEVAKVSGYFTQLAGNEPCMANYVVTTGPITVCLKTSSAWYSYSGGIMSHTNCPSGTADHCVQAVGVKASSSGGYWKLRNNFGVWYGEAGYLRLEYGANACGITYDPIYTSTLVDL